MAATLRRPPAPTGRTSRTAAPAAGRRGVSVALLLLLAAPLLSCSGRSAEQRPLNVLLVLADTLRADHVSGYGYPRETTPHLDELADRGVLFESSRAQAPCTFPSVNSMLTSQETARFLGQPAGHLGIPQEIPTLAGLLRRRGYSTLAVSASPVVRATPSDVNLAGGFGAGFDRFDETCKWGPGECVTQTAIRLLDESHDADREAPFFAYLHYMDPHDPYRPPPAERRRFAGEYTGDKDWVKDGDPNPIAEMLYKNGPDVGVTAEDLAYLRGLYDAEIAYFDSQLADLLTALDNRGLLRSTLVVVTADHGESFLEAGNIKHCRSLFDREIHVPLVIWMPGLETPHRVPAPVASLDVMPTVLDYVDARLRSLAGGGRPAAQPGLEQPGPDATSGGGAADAAIPVLPPMAGQSLRPWIDGETGGGTAVDGRRAEDGQAKGARVVFSSIGVWRSATDGRYKLIHNLARGTWALYDLAADPAETTDVLADHRRAYHRLKAALNAWLAAVESGGDVEATREAQRRLRALGYLQ